MRQLFCIFFWSLLIGEHAQELQSLIPLFDLSRCSCVSFGAILQYIDLLQWGEGNGRWKKSFFEQKIKVMFLLLQGETCESGLGIYCRCCLASRSSFAQVKSVFNIIYLEVYQAQSALFHFHAEQVSLNTVGSRVPLVLFWFKQSSQMFTVC